MELYRIDIDQIKLRGNHGVLPEEERIGQFFLIDLSLMVPKPERFSDDPDQVLNYALIVQAVVKAFHAKRVKLIETLAQNIFDELKGFTEIRSAAIRIAKPTPPIPTALDQVAIELTFER